MGKNKIFNDLLGETPYGNTVETPVNESPALFSLESPAPKADQNVTEKIMIVTGATTLNVRMSPSPKGKVGKTAHEGDKLVVIGKVGEYYQIKAPELPGNVAYVLDKYLK